jgi:hypothetical protein
MDAAADPPEFAAAGEEGLDVVVGGLAVPPAVGLVV